MGHLRDAAALRYWPGEYAGGGFGQTQAGATEAPEYAFGIRRGRLSTAVREKAWRRSERRR